MPQRRKIRGARVRKLILVVYLSCMLIAVIVENLNLRIQSRYDIYFGLFIIFAVVTFQLVLHEGRQKGRRQRGCCLNCGYDLRASPDRCPECGAPASKRYPISP